MLLQINKEDLLYILRNYPLFKSVNEFSSCYKENSYYKEKIYFKDHDFGFSEVTMKYIYKRNKNDVHRFVRISNSFTTILDLSLENISGSLHLTYKRLNKKLYYQLFDLNLVISNNIEDVAIIKRKYTIEKLLH